MSIAFRDSVVNWLKSDASLRQFINGRVYAPVLSEHDKTLPAIVISFLGGREDDYTPVATPIVAIKVYAEDFDESNFLVKIVNTLVHGKNMVDVSDAMVAGGALDNLILNGTLDSADITRPVVWSDWANTGASDGDGAIPETSGGVTIAARYSFALHPTATPGVMVQSIAGVEAGQTHRLRWGLTTTGTMPPGTVTVAISQDGVVGDIATVSYDPSDPAESDTDELCFSPEILNGSQTADITVTFTISLSADNGSDMLLDNITLHPYHGVILSSRNSSVPQEFIERTTGSLKFSIATYRMLIRTE